MFSKLFPKPTSDSLSLDQLDQLSTLIETRITQITMSQHYVGKYRCFCDPSEPALIYFLKTENPIDGTIFMHPLTRKPSAILELTSQAGRTAASFISFDSSVSFFVVMTKYDYEKARNFSKLHATNWTDIPLSLIDANSTACLPLCITPDCGDVFYYNDSSKHFRILSVEKMETHNRCKVEPVEVNQF